jgi:lipid II:glycine glycyltransferase (peptidoglycan interpeptide bridge formation enzyme)
MISLNRKKFGMRILELRYPKNLKIQKNMDVMKIYSFIDQEKKGWKKNPTNTMMIDLSLNLEILKKNIKKKYRKHIRSEELKKIKISQSLNFKKFYKKLYLPLCEKNSLTPYPLKYMKQGELWISEKDDKLLSGSIIFSDTKYATQSFTASKHTEYNGNRLLIWTVIKYYKKEGLKYFNFGGGESDYKRRFGSKTKKIWIYTKYISKKAKFLKKIKELLIK